MVDRMVGTALTSAYPFPQATLPDSRGQHYHIPAGFEAPLPRVFFGYSKCPDVCQAVMADEGVWAEEGDAG